MILSLRTFMSYIPEAHLYIKDIKKVQFTVDFY